MKVTHLLVALAILYVAAISVRLVPLALSTLPYDTGGLLETRIADDIAKSGGLSYPKSAEYINEHHSTITPLYNLFLAILSVIFGVSSVKFAPLLIPFITCITVVMIFMIVLKMTRNKFAALGAGVFFAFSGTYVIATLSPWKEGFGLIMMPLILYLYFNREEDLRIRGLALFLLFLLPIIHHVVTAITYLSITFMTLIPMAQRFSNHRLRKEDKQDFAIIVALWLFALVYYKFSDFNRMEFFKEDSGIWLFASVFCLMLIAGLYAARKTPTNKWFALIPSIIGFGIFAINYFVPIFPYTVGTNEKMITFILPFVVLMFPILLGYILIIDSSSPYRIFIIALFLAPFTIFMFGFFWSLSPTKSYPMIARTFNFMEMGMAITAGVGLAYMMKKLRRKSTRAILVALFIGTILVTTPLAYNTKKAFEVQEETYTWEAGALKWVKDKNPSDLNISTDRKFWEIGHNLYDLKGDYGLPYYLEKQNLPKDRICIIEYQWTQPPGAEMYPLDSQLVSQTELNKLIIPDNNLLGSVGPSNDMIYIMMRP